MDTLEAIHTRRSIRQFKDTLVPDDVLSKVLEAARWAPSWANTQCTRYIVVKDPETKKKLAGLVNRGNPASEAIVNAPIVIVACAELHKSGFYHGTASTNKGEWYMFDVGIAMENLALAAHACGLGTVHVGLIPDFHKLDELLELPENMVSVEIMPLGYPAGEIKGPPRKEMAEIVFYEKYVRR